MSVEPASARATATSSRHRPTPPPRSAAVAVGCGGGRRASRTTTPRSGPAGSAPSPTGSTPDGRGARRPRRRRDRARGPGSPPRSPGRPPSSGSTATSPRRAPASASPSTTPTPERARPGPGAAARPGGRLRGEQLPVRVRRAGNDTASALAAGCPVVVKAHPAHPPAQRPPRRARRRSAAAAGAPEGTFGWSSGLEAGRPWCRRRHRGRRVHRVAARGLALWRWQTSGTGYPGVRRDGHGQPCRRHPARALRLDEVAAGFVGSFTLGSASTAPSPGCSSRPPATTSRRRWQRPCSPPRRAAGCSPNHRRRRQPVSPSWRPAAREVVAAGDPAGGRLGRAGDGARPPRRHALHRVAGSSRSASARGARGGVRRRDRAPGARPAAGAFAATVMTAARTTRTPLGW